MHSTRRRASRVRISPCWPIWLPKDVPGLERLSMGMSGDFETAVKFGATSVRVGSALFGQRPGLGRFDVQRVARRCAILQDGEQIIPFQGYTAQRWRIIRLCAVQKNRGAQPRARGGSSL